MAVVSDNLAVAGIYLAIVTIYLAIASHNMAIGPINMALEQKLHFFHSENRVAMAWRPLGSVY